MAAAKSALACVGWARMSWALALLVAAQHAGVLGRFRVCSGGFKCRPTTSSSWSPSIGSRQCLNLLLGCNGRPLLCHTRCTVVAPPTAARFAATPWDGPGQQLLTRRWVSLFQGGVRPPRKATRCFAPECRVRRQVLVAYEGCLSAGPNTPQFTPQATRAAPC